MSKSTPSSTKKLQTETFEDTTRSTDVEKSSFRPGRPTGTDDVKLTEYTDLTTLESIPTSTATFEPTSTCVNKEIQPETDFAPCTCTLYLNTNEPDIYCDSVNMTDVREGIFKKLNYVYIRSLYLKLIENDAIPSNFLGSAVNQINWFTFDCTNNTNQLEVSPSAFESNKPILFSHVNSIACDFADLSFLSGEMKHVEVMKFENSSNLDEVFAKMPSEFSMNTLEISECTNLKLIDNQNKLPYLLEGMQTFRLSNNKDIKDETLVLLMDWLRENSRDKLNGLYIENNGLTQFPPRISYFSKLQNFTFTGNIIQSGIFGKESLEFSNALTILDLRDCGIEKMEQDAIACKYTLEKIYYSINNVNAKIIISTLFLKRRFFLCRVTPS